jgi:hypothetical protein
MWASCTSSTIRSRCVWTLQPLFMVFGFVMESCDSAVLQGLRHGFACISIWAFESTSMLRRAIIRLGGQIRWGPILEAALEAACMA